MGASKREREFAERLWNAQAVEDVEWVLKQAEDTWGLKEVPVGRENNIGTIRMASDPGLALVERITNGIDSLLEMEMLLQGATGDTSPEEAAAHLFNVPSGGLAEMTDAEVRALAEKLSVTFLESGKKKRPSVRVEDHGMGQHPLDFAGTLLSLNESNKVDKPYTMGTYGQGGSVTFGFSQHTVIVSRRHPLLLDGRLDEVGWTIVYEVEGDPALNRLPWYVWVVRPDGSPFTLPIECFSELAHGTRITHVQYDAQRLALPPVNSNVYPFMHATLVDPVLPFVLGGTRTESERKAKDRPIKGNVARLNSPDKMKGKVEVAVDDTHVLDLGPKYGQVEISYWALRRTDESAADAAAYYVQADNAVSLTLNGQRQDSQDRRWIKDKAQLPYLYKNTVVHINGNGLTPIGRREVFAATRERATDSDLKQAIYSETADLLRNDEGLKQLNHEEKEKLLNKSTAATNDKIRRRLGQFIKTKLKGTTSDGSKGTKQGKGKGDSTGTGGGSGQGNPGGGGSGKSERNIDDSNLPNVPTSIAFARKFMRISQGFKGSVWVDIDAKNGYLPDHEDELTVHLTGDGDPLPVLQSQSKLLGGRSLWYVRVDEDVPLGDYMMTANLDSANGLLEAEVPIKVVEPAEPSKRSSKGADEATGPEVKWVLKENWTAHDMDATIVGSVKVDNESTIIYVNQDFDLLAKAVKSRNLTAAQVETRRDRYQLPVACGLWLQWHEIDKMFNKDEAPTEAYQYEEMRRLAEAVLTTMDPDVDAAAMEEED